MEAPGGSFTDGMGGKVTRVKLVSWMESSRVVTWSEGTAQAEPARVWVVCCACGRSSCGIGQSKHSVVRGVWLAGIAAAAGWDRGGVWAVGRLVGSLRAGGEENETPG